MMKKLIEISKGIILFSVLMLLMWINLNLIITNCTNDILHQHPINKGY